MKTRGYLKQLELRAARRKRGLCILCGEKATHSKTYCDRHLIQYRLRIRKKHGMKKKTKNGRGRNPLIPDNYLLAAKQPTLEGAALELNGLTAKTRTRKSVTPKPKNKKCLTPSCSSTTVQARGLCHPCYVAAQKAVKDGKTSWEKLEATGKALHAWVNKDGFSRRQWFLS